jgi:hypothetical protein
VVSQAQTTNEKALVYGAGDDLRRDAVEPQLRSAKQCEVLGVVHGAPRQVDESSARRALDVRTLEVKTPGGRDGHAVDGPGRGSRIAGGQSKQLVAAVPALDCDMDIVVAARRSQGWESSRALGDRRPRSGSTHRQYRLPGASDDLTQDRLGGGERAQRQPPGTGDHAVGVISAMRPCWRSAARTVRRAVSALGQCATRSSSTRTAAVPDRPHPTTGLGHS